MDCVWSSCLCRFLFHSVQAAEVLVQEGLKFIGVVKTATKMFPMKHLQSVELEGGGGGG